MFGKNILLCSLILISFLLVSANLVSGQENNNLTSLLKLARDHMNLFQFDKAFLLLQKAIQMDPENWEANYLAGRCLQRQNKNIESEKFFKRANKLNPNDYEVRKALSSFYLVMAKTAQNNFKSDVMEDYLLKACQADPSITKIWIVVLKNWWKTGQYEKIKKEGKTIIRSNTRLLEQGEDKFFQAALLIIARTYSREKDFVSAEQYLAAALRIRHANDDLYEFKRELKIEAEKSVKKLLDKYQSYYQKGNYEESLNILKSISSKSSKVTDLIEELEKKIHKKKVIEKIEVLIKQDKLQNAIEEIEALLVDFPENQGLLDIYAQTNEKIEKVETERAETSAKQASEEQRILEKNRRIGSLTKKANENKSKKNYDIAIMNYESILKLQPENVEASTAIENLKLLLLKENTRQEKFRTDFADMKAYFKSENYESAFSNGIVLMQDFEEHKDVVAPIFAEACLFLQKFEKADKTADMFESQKEEADIYNYIKGMVAYNQGDKGTALTYLENIEKSDFRSDMASTIRFLYVYKFRHVIYGFILIAFFPAIVISKDIAAAWRVKRRVAKLDKIRETGQYLENISFLEMRYSKADIPNPKQVIVMFAEALLRKGDYKQAYGLVSSLLKKDARNANARRIAGEACLALEDTSIAALEHIHGLLKIDESRKDVVLFSAQSYINQEADHKTAQDFILKALSINPNDTSMLIYLANIYIKRRIYTKQTLKVFGKCCKASPDTPDFFHAIIENYKHLNDFVEAKKYCDIASEKFPGDNRFSDISSMQANTNVYTRTEQDNMPNNESIGVKHSDQMMKPQIPTDMSNRGFPDYDSIGTNGNADFFELAGIKIPDTPPKSEKQAQITGPKKNCPHCEAVNAVKEYYCTTCGKAFGG